MSGLLSGLLSTPARVAAVAGVTFVQLVRMKLFLAVGALALLLLGLQFLPYQESISVEYSGVEQLHLLKDIGIGCMQLFGLIFCVATTSLLIPRDSEDRILYTILCKPVPRFDYLLGKLLGVLLLLLITFALMDGLLSLLIHLREGDITARVTDVLRSRGADADIIDQAVAHIHVAAGYGQMQQGIIAMGLGLAVLTSLTLLLSCCTSGTIISMIFALSAYFIGMFQQQLFTLLHSGEGVGPGLRLLTGCVSVLLPDFSLFSLTDATSAGADPGLGMMLRLALLALGYMLLHLLTATWIFSRKEF